MFSVDEFKPNSTAIDLWGICVDLRLYFGGGCVSNASVNFVVDRAKERNCGRQGMSLFGISWTL